MASAEGAVVTFLRQVEFRNTGRWEGVGGGKIYQSQRCDNEEEGYRVYHSQ